MSPIGPGLAALEESDEYKRPRPGACPIRRAEAARPAGLARRIRQGLAAALALLAALVGVPSTAEEVIRHSLSQQQNAPAITYELALLTLLLDKTVDRYGPYRLEAMRRSSQQRAFAQLGEGRLDVATSMTSRTREQQAIPVRVCLYRGLLGVRLPIALADRAVALEPLTDPAQVARLRIGQVFDWPDAAILAANHWAVYPIDDFHSFPSMLRAARFDLFALGAIEVYPIVDPMRTDGIVVLERWAIAYPSAFYFFVSPRRPALAARLQLGFERALGDGSFVTLFDRYVGPQLARAQLARRHWFVLANPTLPRATLLATRKLWDPLVWERLRAVRRVEPPAPERTPTQ